MTMTKTTKPTDKLSPRAHSKSEEDIYKDFENIYLALVHEPVYNAQRAPTNAQQNKPNQTSNRSTTKSPQMPVTIRVDECVSDVERALRRVALEAAAIEMVPNAQEQQVHLLTPGQRRPLSPAVSMGDTSEQTTRADSRETIQSYLLGPALVEEMTLSDLEDEICSTLMAAKSSCRSQAQKNDRTAMQNGASLYSIRVPRSRNPLPASLSSRLI